MQHWVINSFLNNMAHYLEIIMMVIHANMPFTFEQKTKVKGIGAFDVCVKTLLRVAVEEKIKYKTKIHK